MSSKNTEGITDMGDILELAKLLRKNGDKVLSGASKLSLSEKLLHDLNDAFSIIVDDKQDLETSFHVCNSSKNDIFRDLKFLHDFVQKTVWLKVSHGANDPRVSIDISKFRHLRFLELQKICIDQVSGIQGVRGQLESITCSGGGGVGTVGRLLASCGRDAGVGFVWASLTRLALAYNGLGRLDKSLELAPWLQTLDLSHNLIVNASELDYLPNLKNVNLSYNKLETAPRFNKAAYQTLRILILKNNYIENLDGLQGLDCLAELDLSYNCLTDHSVLWPLETMSTLLWVNLEGNPLSYDSLHRYRTSKYLHSALSESKFVLDHQPLNKMEKSRVSTNRAIFLNRPTRSPLKNDAASLSCSIRSDITSSTIDHSHLPDVTSSRHNMTDSTETIVSRNRRKKYVREAVITDHDNNKENPDNVASSVTSSKMSFLEASADHLETKKQILALREKIGDDNWLTSHAGSYIQDIMGIERPNVSVLTDASGIDFTTSPTNASTEHSTVDQSSKVGVIGNLGNFSSDLAYDSAIHSNESSSDDAAVESTVCSVEEIYCQEQQLFSDQNTTNGGQDKATKIEEAPYDPEEEKGELFLVLKKVNDEMEGCFLVISPEYITERDSMSGQIINRWSTDSVLSCVMGRGETPKIDFIFDTTRKDRQNRTYFVDQDDATKIVGILGELIKARPITLKVFKCMKCSTHFSQDMDYLTAITTTTISNIKPPKCPSCRSTLVIQTDELITPDVEHAKKMAEKSPIKSTIEDNTEDNSNLHHSESHSSIGGTEGGAMPVTNSLVQFDSRPQAQVSCSATSLEESRESTPSASTVTKRYESDIEILSNPSQSSIEVLDDGTKASSTPSRKRSSEERRVAIAPTLVTIPDIAPVMTGLTESSSSGSLTDSICTTYENRIPRGSGLTGKRHRKLTETEITTNSESAKDNTPLTPVGNLTSMLGGLLQSIKIGTNRDSSPKSDEVSNLFESDIVYSYEDFASVDHRIKLHLILNVFERENEKLLMLLRAQILMRDSAEAFQGCLVVSNAKVYVLKIIGQEGNGDPQRWLHKETSWTNDKLQCLAPLPFKQGILLKYFQRSKSQDEWTEATVACITQDLQRTMNLLFCLTNLEPFSLCQFETSGQCNTPLEKAILSSSTASQQDTIRFLAFFELATFIQNDLDVKLKTGGLIVTCSTLLLTGERIHWLLPDVEETPKIFAQHSMSNLIEVKHDRSCLELSFIDEVAGIEDTWTLSFVSSDAAKRVIHAIETPWESLFSVPLQVIETTEDD